MPPYADPRQEPEGPVYQGGLKEKRAAEALRPGQLDTVTQALLNRQKELASRRCYLRNFWYAVGMSDCLAKDSVMPGHDLCKVCLSFDCVVCDVLLSAAMALQNQRHSCSQQWP